jgi:hypothetical protein
MNDQITVRQLLDAMDALSEKFKTLPRKAARRDHIPAELINAFNDKLGPFSRDVVVSREVAHFMRHSNKHPSADTVGRWLCSDTFMGEPKAWRWGETRYRGAIIRNHARWRNASGPDIMAHIAGDSDELLS